MCIRSKLGTWYEREKRDLPWRNSTDIYRIWLSEIILQQTRIAQGIPYYLRFITQYPDIFALASAETEDILKTWQGLGYYSRARNLHATAREIVSKYSGKFPSSSRELLKLKGIGEYTAAAIASVVFNEPVAAVDGNVKRIIARLFVVNEDLNSGSGTKQVNALAQDILDRENPGRHNQAMMDLGALVCLPRNPVCSECPLNSHCMAFKENLVEELPLRYRKAVSSNRYFYYLIIKERKRTWIRQRKKGDIWEGLYDFPMIETNEAKTYQEIAEMISGFLADSEFILERISEPVIHKLSHRNLHSWFIHISLTQNTIFPDTDLKTINISEFHKYPVPVLLDHYINEYGF